MVIHTILMIKILEKEEDRLEDLKEEAFVEPITDVEKMEIEHIISLLIKKKKNTRIKNNSRVENMNEEGVESSHSEEVVRGEALVTRRALMNEGKEPDVSVKLQKGNLGCGFLGVTSFDKFIK
jgi:hypothetical protein